MNLMIYWINEGTRDIVTENNCTCRSSLGEPNPLCLLEDLWVGDEKDLAKRQVGFCAQWCLDNLCKFGLVSLPYQFNQLTHIF